MILAPKLMHALSHERAGQTSGIKQQSGAPAGFVAVKFSDIMGRTMAPSIAM